MKTIAAVESLADKLLAIQGGECFICRKQINLATDTTEIDHIIPRARGGKDDDNNYAIVHEWCNRTKSDSDLRIARCLAHYEQIKEKASAQDPKRPNLDDFLTEVAGAKYPLHISRADGFVTVSLPEIGRPAARFPLYRDKLSGCEYIFLMLPLEYLHHDDRINPQSSEWQNSRVTCK